MPNLSESLQGRDLGHLRIVAEFWGIELNAPDTRTALPQLAAAMLDAQLAGEIVNDLPEQAQAALQDLKQQGGRIPWALFTRRYGEVREMGVGRRDREQPYLEPVSAAELLWYYGLLARAFFDIAEGVEEFAYIPNDLLPLLSLRSYQPPVVLGRAAFHAEYTHTMLASERILDHACTLLAILRSGLPVPDEFSISPYTFPLPSQALQSLLLSGGMIDETLQPVPEAARLFLESPPGEALAGLVSTWKQSQHFNELRLVPGLSSEGSWQNDPLQTRLLLLDLLESIPGGEWWNLSSFIAALKQHQPDFQRSGGEYDTWFIRNLETGEFLRGFESWDQVEGAWLVFFVTGPLAWLGLVDLASAQPGGAVTAFRLSAWAGPLLVGKAPDGLPQEAAKLVLRSDAYLHAPRLTPRAVRYQVARFCQWDKETPAGYDYHITPASLVRARQQGLAVQHLLGLLRKSAEAVPPSLVKALERWEAQGSQAQIETLSVLRFYSPEILPALRKSRAARYLGEPLGPAAIAVKPGAEKKVLDILAELGYLGELKPEAK